LGLKVLFVTHGFPPSDIAGTELLAKWIGNSLVRKGHQVSVFCPSFSPDRESSSVVEGMEVNRVFISPNNRTAFSDTYTDEIADFSFAKLVRKIKPDVAVIWHTIFLSAGVLEVLSQMRIPYVVFLADFHYMCHQTSLLTANLQPCDGPGDGTKCRDCIIATVPRELQTDDFDAAEQGRRRVSRMREVLSNATCLVAPSKFVNEKYTEFGIDPRNIHVIEPGINIDAIREKHSRSASPELRFGYLGGNLQHKGISVLLDAFRSVQSSGAKLLMAGPAMEPSPPSTAIANVRNLGRFANEDVGRILSDIDVLVVPSICHEAYGIVIREAFAAEIPVIVSDLRAQSDAVREGVDGLRFRSGDSADLASKMMLLIRTPKKVQELSRKMPPVPVIDKMANEMERLITDVFNSKAEKLAARADMPTLQERIDHVQFELLELKATNKTRERELIRSRNRNEKLEEENSNLRSQLASVQQEVSSKDVDLRVLRDENVTAHTKLESMQNNLLSMQDDMKKAREVNSTLGSELSSIKESFGYRIMRFYARRIDQLFPDGTRRGNLRKRLVRRLNNP
jgi:glycosyltransferase involved in cell wall biosynthesis/uncharacterized protein (UPF0335 family)